MVVWYTSTYARGLSWSYSTWIYNFLCNRCLSPLPLWVRIPLGRGVFDTTLCDKVCQWLAAGRWISLGTPVSSINKTDRHDIQCMAKSESSKWPTSDVITSDVNGFNGLVMSTDSMDYFINKKTLLVPNILLTWQSLFGIDAYKLHVCNAEEGSSIFLSFLPQVGSRFWRRLSGFLNRS